MFMRVQSLKFIKLWKERCPLSTEMPRGRLLTQKDVLYFLRNAVPAALKTEAPPVGNGEDNDPDEWAEAAKGALLEFVRALEEGRITIVEEESEDNNDDCHCFATCCCGGP